MMVNIFDVWQVAVEIIRGLILVAMLILFFLWFHHQISRVVDAIERIAPPADEPESKKD